MDDVIIGDFADYHIEKIDGYRIVITVFGFSAPVTDKEAISLMKNAYQESGIKEIALFDAILQCHPREENKVFSDFNSLEDLHAFVETIDEFELYFESVT